MWVLVNPRERHRLPQHHREGNFPMVLVSLGGGMERAELVEVSCSELRGCASLEPTEELREEGGGGKV